jgi:hypothetical protein
VKNVLLIFGIFNKGDKMLFATLKDIKIGQSNCGYQCKKCTKKNVFYSILNGNYVYYCLNCKEWINTKLYRSFNEFLSIGGKYD